MKKRIARWKDFLDIKQAFLYWIKLLKESACAPTKAKELVMGDPEFLGWVYAYVEGVGGGCLLGKMHWKQQICAWNGKINCGPS